MYLNRRIAGGHLPIEGGQRGIAGLGKGCQVVIGPQLVAPVITRGRLPASLGGEPLNIFGIERVLDVLISHKDRRHDIAGDERKRYASVLRYRPVNEILKALTLLGGTRLRRPNRHSKRSNQPINDLIEAVISMFSG